MTLQDLAGTHRADVYALTSTQDALMGSVEALASSKTATLPCRFVPMSRKDQEKYGSAGENEMYKVLFASDPDLSNAAVLVWSSKVWRVREVINSGGIDLVWHAVVEHAPQIELAAP